MDERITPTFIHTEEKRLVGLKQTMSLTHNLTGELWKLFMQQYPISTNRISLQVYHQTISKILVRTHHSKNGRWLKQSILKPFLHPLNNLFCHQVCMQFFITKV